MVDMNRLTIEVDTRSRAHSNPQKWVHIPKRTVPFMTPQPSPRTAGAGPQKPLITHAQHVREAFILKTAEEMFENFYSTVLEVKLTHGRRIMWTSIPDDLRHIFNCTDLKTVDSWKQTMHGNVQLDISMFKPGDKVKMQVQSVGVSGKHCHQPLMRGVPDPEVQKETLIPLSATPGQMESLTSPVTPRLTTPRLSRPSRPSRLTITAPVKGDEPADKVHRRFSAKKPVAASRFSRLSEANRKTFTAHSMLPRSRKSTAANESEAKL